MTAERVVLGVLLVALPIAFNVLFLALARTFEYPDILRHETDDILGRFTAGGRRLLLLWWAFMATAVALVPVAALLAAHLEPAGSGIATTSLALGVTAGLVQAMGLARWPFLVPVLAARHAGAASDAERAAVGIVFDAAHRYLGVAVGEHLGYLLTGAWTVVVGLGLAVAPGSLAILGWAGIALGLLLAAGSLEFVGRPGDRGWPFAEKLVPVAYLGWSAWLFAVGVAILAGAA
ncbi:MAG TPA: DUF4386 family protein [Candidatus Limnocylindrales bacterium]|nr:DUF4386 family protein [Candidatus Limnocylindrales bacterium]